MTRWLWNTLRLGVTWRFAPHVTLSMCRWCTGSICIDRHPDAHRNVYVNSYLNHVFITTYTAPALCYGAYCTFILPELVAPSTQQHQIMMHMLSAHKQYSHSSAAPPWSFQYHASILLLLWAQETQICIDVMIRDGAVAEVALTQVMWCCSLASALYLLPTSTYTLCTKIIQNSIWELFLPLLCWNDALHMVLMNATHDAEVTAAQSLSPLWHSSPPPPPPPPPPTYPQVPPNSSHCEYQVSFDSFIHLFSHCLFDPPLACVTNLSLFVQQLDWVMWAWMVATSTQWGQDSIPRPSGYQSTLQMVTTMWCIWAWNGYNRMALLSCDSESQAIWR